MDQNSILLLHTSTLGRRLEPEKKVLQRQNSIYLMLKAFPTVLRIRFFGRGPEKKKKSGAQKTINQCSFTFQSLSSSAYTMPDVNMRVRAKSVITWENVVVDVDRSTSKAISKNPQWALRLGLIQRNIRSQLTPPHLPHRPRPHHLRSTPSDRLFCGPPRRVDHDFPFST